MKPITLSFDNGPSPGITERVLDTLAERAVRTTFFVVGDRLRDPTARRLAERAVAEGHWVGNHTMTHSVQLGAAADDSVHEREIGAAQEIIGSLSHGDRFFRPYGAGGVLTNELLSPGAVEYLQGGSYSLVLWSIVPRDWDPSVDWVESCLSHARTQAWPLVVLHDLPGCAPERLPELLDRLAAEGFEVRQEIPDHSMPMHRGAMRATIDHLVRSH
ncbi:MAG TPA: polysaccharide deacetylase family protein [Candidatus Limnocylindrales bacterium]|nr:polysaccharide deacetylase family protein [Candidatus Limnocylindrales bacterium]